MLDWYSGHRTEEVEALLMRKGHVLLFHGGGTTPFTQINDTHLHAQVQRLMVAIENLWAHSQQKAARAAGHKITPCPKRDDTCRIVQSMWMSVDHARVAAKGYKQLGPLMAFDGPVDRADVFSDLLSVLEEIDPPDFPGGVGVALREEAKAYVQAGYDAYKWRNWDDVSRLIEEHDCDDHPEDEEGMEAFNNVDLTDDSSNSDGGADDGDDGDLWEEAATRDDAAPVATILDSDDEVGGDPIPTAAAVPGGPTPDELEKARQVLIQYHKTTGEDSFLRRLYEESARSIRDKKDGATDSACALKKRMHAIEEEENKRRKANREAERLAANEDEEKKEKRARAQEAASIARAAELRLLVHNRKDIEARAHRAAARKEAARWLQTTYPVEVAISLIERWQNSTEERKKRTYTRMWNALESKVFERMLGIANIWVTDTTFTTQWVQVKQPTDPLHMRWVRCSPAFLNSVLHRFVVLGPDQDAANILMRLFEAILPLARRALLQNASYSMVRILHENDYVMEKAFVWGVIAFSKWLGRDQFKNGIHDWPPALPANLASMTMVEPVIIKDDVPPNLRASLGSGSAG